MNCHFLPPGHLSDPGIKPRSPASSALSRGFFTTELLGKCFLHAVTSKMGFPGGSAGKESACNVGDLGSIPGLGRSPVGGQGYPLQYSGLENSMDCMGFPCDSATKESSCNTRDLGSIPGLGRCPGEGKGYLLQDSGLENAMDQSMGSQRVRHITHLK